MILIVMVDILFSLAFVASVQYETHRNYLTILIVGVIFSLNKVQSSIIGYSAYVFMEMKHSPRKSNYFT